jgi:hypothetical protein
MFNCWVSFLNFTMVLTWQGKIGRGATEWVKSGVERGNRTQNLGESTEGNCRTAGEVMNNRRKGTEKKMESAVERCILASSTSLGELQWVPSSHRDAAHQCERSMSSMRELRNRSRVTVRPGRC